MSAVKSALAVLWRAATLLAVISCGHAFGAPCDGIGHALPEAEKMALGAAVAPQLGASRVDILQSLQLGTWRILYVDSHVADEAFLFFSGDPRSSHYVTMWSGGAARDEDASIRQWVIANARGIPPDLASCFAWHVTSGQDR